MKRLALAAMLVISGCTDFHDKSEKDQMLWIAAGAAALTVFSVVAAVAGGPSQEPMQTPLPMPPPAPPRH